MTVRLTVHGEDYSIFLFILFTKCYWYTPVWQLILYIYFIHYFSCPTKDYFKVIFYVPTFIIVMYFLILFIYCQSFALIGCTKYLSEILNKINKIKRSAGYGHVYGLARINKYSFSLLLNEEYCDTSNNSCGREFYRSVALFTKWLWYIFVLQFAL